MMTKTVETVSMDSTVLHTSITLLDLSVPSFTFVSRPSSWSGWVRVKDRVGWG